MDIVITYVNREDPLWLEDYERVVGGRPSGKRFRDWGTLKYLLRGVEAHMPFVGKIFLVVSRDSQVPSWVNRDRVSVVLHSDIAPQSCLPLFNSSSIEMFLHRIPGLDERFVYFNDDMFPMADMSEDDFFVDGKPSCGVRRQLFVFGNSFRSLCRRDSDFARKVLGLPRSAFYIRPQHSVDPKLRSECDELYENCREEILSGITPLRSGSNLSQYVFVDYMYFKGMICTRRLSSRYISLGVQPLPMVCRSILKPSRKLLCINDAKMSEGRFKRYRKRIVEVFESVFPEKSACEL